MFHGSQQGIMRAIDAGNLNGSGVTRPVKMATIGLIRVDKSVCGTRVRETSSVIALRSSLLAVAAVAGLVVLSPVRAHAQWWRGTPVDFESCADAAEKAKSKEEKTSALAECNAKFAGRRKPGGGYTYYDFMQDRTFDIAGPNPTPEEQKKIDEQYTAYLERERRNHVAAALAAKQQQPEPPPAQDLQQVSLRSDPVSSPLAENEKVPVPVASPGLAGGAHQGCPMRQEPVLVRMAAAFREGQRDQKAVQPAATAAATTSGQAEEELGYLRRSCERRDP